MSFGTGMMATPSASSFSLRDWDRVSLYILHDPDMAPPGISRRLEVMYSGNPMSRAMLTLGPNAGQRWMQAAHPLPSRWHSPWGPDEPVASTNASARNTWPWSDST